MEKSNRSCTFDFVEDTTAREKSNKICFSAHLIVPLHTSKMNCDGY